MPQPSAAIRPEDAIVLFLDLQEGIVELTRTQPLPSLRKSVGALASLAKVFDLPVFVSAVREGGKDAVMLPEISAAIGPYDIHYRTTCDALRNEAILHAIEQTGRRSLLLSGVATELAVQLPALSAAAVGLQAYAVIDACGGVAERTERAALDRIYAGGGRSISVLTLAGEIAGDLREPLGQQAAGILFGVAQG